jgi:uncharacterized coiled-coil protein SlyX
MADINTTTLELTPDQIAEKAAREGGAEIINDVVEGKPVEVIDLTAEHVGQQAAESASNIENAATDSQESLHAVAISAIDTPEVKNLVNEGETKITGIRTESTAAISEIVTTPEPVKQYEEEKVAADSIAEEISNFNTAAEVGKVEVVNKIPEIQPEIKPEIKIETPASDITVQDIEGVHREIEMGGISQKETVDGLNKEKKEQESHLGEKPASKDSQNPKDEHFNAYNILRSIPFLGSKADRMEAKNAMGKSQELSVEISRVQAKVDFLTGRLESTKDQNEVARIKKNLADLVGEPAVEGAPSADRKKGTLELLTIEKERRDNRCKETAKITMDRISEKMAPQTERVEQLKDQLNNLSDHMTKWNTYIAEQQAERAQYANSPKALRAFEKAINKAKKEIQAIEKQRGALAKEYVPLNLKLKSLEIESDTYSDMLGVPHISKHSDLNDAVSASSNLNPSLNFDSTSSSEESEPEEEAETENEVEEIKQKPVEKPEAKVEEKPVPVAEAVKPQTAAPVEQPVAPEVKPYEIKSEAVPVQVVPEVKATGENKKPGSSIERRKAALAQEVKFPLTPEKYEELKEKVLAREKKLLEAINKSSAEEKKLLRKAIMTRSYLTLSGNAITRKATVRDLEALDSKIDKGFKKLRQSDAKVLSEKKKALEDKTK